MSRFVSPYKISEQPDKKDLGRHIYINGRITPVWHEIACIDTRKFPYCLPLLESTFQRYFGCSFGPGYYYLHLDDPDPTFAIHFFEDIIDIFNVNFPDFNRNQIVLLSRELRPELLLTVEVA